MLLTGTAVHAMNGALAANLEGFDTNDFAVRSTMAELLKALVPDVHRIGFFYIY